MTEIRAIRKHEAEDYLQLLCDVFDLDYTRAYGVFFTEPLFDLDRKWALFEGKEMISVLTTSPLIFGWGRAFGIAGVATRPDRQREGFGGRLLERVLLEGRHRGEGASLLFAREPFLYERCGFRVLDRVVRAQIECRPEAEDRTINSGAARCIYDAWAEAHPDRLRRDELRWKYWNWHFRICTALQSGYICFEPGVFREAIFEHPQSALPLPHNTEWFGLSSMAEMMRLPISNPREELYIMGYNFPAAPQMFMTDQF